MTDQITLEIARMTREFEARVVARVQALQCGELFRGLPNGGIDSERASPKVNSENCK